MVLPSRIGWTGSLRQGNTIMTVFETERLALRYLRRDDLEDFLELVSDPEIIRYMDDGQPLTREQTERWIEVSLANYEARGYGCFGVTMHDEDRMVGFAGFARPSDRPGVTEIIYALPPALWGKGYATEVARGLISFGLGRAGLERIEATVDPANEPSARVLIKAGMVYDGRRAGEDGSETDFFSIERPVDVADPR